MDVTKCDVLQGDSNISSCSVVFVDLIHTVHSWICLQYLESDIYIIGADINDVLHPLVTS